MRAHALDKAALEAEEFFTERMAGRGKSSDWALKLSGAIASFSGTYCYLNRAQLVFSGRDSDVVFASWLTEALADFVKRQTKNYGPGASAIEKRSFGLGCCLRITGRPSAIPRARPCAQGLGPRDRASKHSSSDSPESPHIGRL